MTKRSMVCGGLFPCGILYVIFIGESAKKRKLVDSLCVTSSSSLPWWAPYSRVALSFRYDRYMLPTVCYIPKAVFINGGTFAFSVGK